MSLNPESQNLLCEYNKEFNREKQIVKEKKDFN